MEAEARMPATASEAAGDGRCAFQRRGPLGTVGPIGPIAPMASIDPTRSKNEQNQPIKKI